MMLMGYWEQVGETNKRAALSPRRRMLIDISFVALLSALTAVLIAIGWLFARL